MTSLKVAELRWVDIVRKCLDEQQREAIRELLCDMMTQAVVRSATGEAAEVEAINE